MINVYLSSFIEQEFCDDYKKTQWEVSNIAILFIL